ncbi:MAG: TIGR01244 family sulfur transferase [Alphaproteobacteria bacterium]|nr:TIGR01244 family sulfur transferase [Alphaproteobacteria bacterium]
MDLGAKLTDALTVSPQIQAEDVAEIAAAGFKMIVCNRPDGEELGQPPFSLIERAAAEAGLEARFLPVVSGGMTLENVEDFGLALNEASGPVFAYCRSGTRCTALWSLNAVKDRPVSEVIETAARAGYDMSGLLGREG